MYLELTVKDEFPATLTVSTTFHEIPSIKVDLFRYMFSI